MRTIFLPQGHIWRPSAMCKCWTEEWLPGTKTLTQFGYQWEQWPGDPERPLLGYGTSSAEPLSPRAACFCLCHPQEVHILMVLSSQESWPLTSAAWLSYYPTRVVHPCVWRTQRAEGQWLPHRCLRSARDTWMFSAPCVGRHDWDPGCIVGHTCTVTVWIKIVPGCLGKSCLADKILINKTVIGTER